jgi:hypothetical protein
MLRPRGEIIGRVEFLFEESMEVNVKSFVAAAFLLAPALAQPGQAPAAPTDPWKALGFLEGTWEARTQGGSANAQGSGTYTFEPELKHHVLVRRSGNSAACRGPKDFDCEHSDVLYVYQEAEGRPLKAIYFDNEGHVIHYQVSTGNSTRALFISDPSQPGPRFRLVYELKDAVMSGKFQMRMPGQAKWKSYLEWTGAKR